MIGESRQFPYELLKPRNRTNQAEMEFDERGGAEGDGSWYYRTEQGELRLLPKKSTLKAVVLTALPQQQANIQENLELLERHGVRNPRDMLHDSGFLRLERAGYHYSALVALHYEAAMGPVVPEAKMGFLQRLFRKDPRRPQDLPPWQLEQIDQAHLVKEDKSPHVQIACDRP